MKTACTACSDGAVKETMASDGVMTAETNGGFFPPPQQEDWIARSLLHMGYPSLEKSRNEIRGMVQDCAMKVPGTTSPKCLFRMEAIKSHSQIGFSTGGLNIRSLKWGKLLSLAGGRKHVCCYAVTLGRKSEAVIQGLGAQSIMKGFIWDALCSTLAEHYAGQAERHIAKWFTTMGLASTRRFSPGYCDLDLVDGQKSLFGFCNPEQIGIHLSQSGLMTPRKSTTGMVLAAEEMPLGFPCGFCKSGCKHRRAPYQDANPAA